MEIMKSSFGFVHQINNVWGPAVGLPTGIVYLLVIVPATGRAFYFTRIMATSRKLSILDSQQTNLNLMKQNS